jgi:TP901 family phage tail tape measure protein
MADVNANIGVNIDTSLALTQLKSLQRQISQFHTSISRSSETAAIAQKSLQKNFLNSVNAIGAFSAELRTVKSTTESFTASLEGNKFSMREYFRYAGGSTKTFGRLFKSEFDTIGKVAEDRVKKMQTQYIKMGRDINGAMQAISITPTALDMENYGTKTAIAAQKQALFNQLMKQGSTNLLNFGKNTQWAGRQLMVGFTIPLAMVGSAATKTFMDMETQAIKFKKVYGDLFTPKAETQQALDNITELGKAFTKYGVAVSTTVGLAAEAAAAGFSGLDLQRQTAEATRLSILGQLDSQKALETTISLQNAFAMSSENLAESIDFLNAVENQTVVSLDDITTAIPKVAPVIQQLGGDVKDLTFFMAAMKEGGINASEGANALKSGLGSLINPTGRASEMLKSFGINANEIVTKNKGNLKATVIEFAEALNELDPLNRAQVIEQMFGKFQFARLSTLFANVAKDGNQAARVLSLANSSVEDLAALSEQELGMTAESSMNKFKKAVEDLKVALVPVGQAFLEAVTPIVDFVAGILEKFGNLSDGTKKAITIMTVAIGAIGPIALMTFGLLANGVANIIKLFLTLRNGYLRLTGQSQILGEQTNYLTTEQMEAAAASHSLNQAHATLTQQFTAESTAVNQLIAAYQGATRAGAAFAMANPGAMIPRSKKYANGVVSVPGSGNKDTVPAMLTPGEAVIPAAMAKKYAPLINGMIAGNIPGYNGGNLGAAAGPTADVGSVNIKLYKDLTMLLQGWLNQQLGNQGAAVKDVLASLDQSRGGAAAPILAAIVKELGLNEDDPGIQKEIVNLANDIVDNIYYELEAAFRFSGKDIMFDKDLENIAVPVIKDITEDATMGGKPVKQVVKDLEQFRTMAMVGSGEGSRVSRKGLADNYVAKGGLTQKIAKIINPDTFQTRLRLRETKGDAGEDLYENQFQIKNLPGRDTEFTGAQMSHLAEGTTVSAREGVELTKGYIIDAESKIMEYATKADAERVRRGEESAKKRIEKEAIAAEKDAAKADELAAKKNEKAKIAADKLAATTGAGADKAAKASQKAADAAAKANEVASQRSIVAVEKTTAASVMAAEEVETKTRIAAERTAAAAAKPRDKNLAKQAAAAQLELAQAQELATKLELIRKRSLERSIAAQELAGVKSAQIATKTGQQAISALNGGAGTQSPSKKTIKTGEDIGKGLEIGMQSRKDEVSAVAQGLGKAAADGTRVRRASFRPEGPPPVISQQAVKNISEQSAVIQKSRRSLEGFDRNLMGASFAISSLSGLASMSGGKLGEMSGAISKLTGALFALQAVTSLLTSTNLLKLASDRAGLALTAMKMAKGTIGNGMVGVAGMSGAVGKSGIMGSLARVGLGLTKFLGPVGLATTAAGLLYVGFKKYQSTQEKARLAVEGLGDAAVLTSGKVKTLEDFFGVKATKSPLQRTGSQLVLDKQKRSQVDELRASEDFQKNFGKDIEALRNASNKEVGLIFKSIAMQLSSQGFSKANIDIIVKSLQEEAGKTNVAFDFSSIDLKTEKGRKGIVKTAKNLGKVLSQEITKAQNKEDAKAARTGASFNDKSIGALANRSEELKKTLSTISKVYAGFFESLSTGFKSGQISAQEFNSSFGEISTTIKNMPPADGMALLNAILKTMPNDLAKTALGLKDNADKLLILQAAALGVATITPEMVKALGKAKAPGATAEDKRIANLVRNNIIGTMEDITEVQEILNETLKGSTKGYKDLNTTTEEGNAVTDKRIVALNKEIDILEKKRDAQKDSNDELQRQIDLEKKQFDLANEATQAKLSGDYIKAAMVQQESLSVLNQFNRETELRKEDAKIEALKAQVERLEAENKAKADKKQKAVKKKAAGGYITGRGTGTSDSIPALLSNGEYVIKASAVGKYGKEFLDDLNAKKFAKGGMAGAPHQLGMGSGSGKKLNTFQKLMMTMAKDSGPLSSFLGLGSLYKSLAGQGSTGDKLSSAMIPLGSMSRVAKGAGSAFGKAIPQSRLDELTQKWPPNERFYKPGFQYMLGNQDPLHGPLQIGMSQNLKRFSGYKPNDYSSAQQVAFNDQQFGRLNIMPAFLTGTMKDRGMYATAQYMEGNKDIMSQMERLGNHPLGPIAAMKTLQQKFSGKLFRGVKLGRTFKGLPQDLIDSIKLARETGDSSALIGKEFIMRRSSWSKSPYIANFFAPGKNVNKDSLVIAANVRNRNIVPASDLFPDKKFSAPGGQDWSGGSKFGNHYRSEEEAIFGGKFRIVGFKDGQLDVQTISGASKFANGGMVNMPKFHDWNGPVPGTYGQDLPAILKSGTEGIYQEKYINDLKQAASNANSGSTVYNIDMTVNGAGSDPAQVAEMVMKKMEVVMNKNNKTNVGLR